MTHFQRRGPRKKRPGQRRRKSRQQQNRSRVQKRLLRNQRRLRLQRLTSMRRTRRWVPLKSKPTLVQNLRERVLVRYKVR